MKKLLLLIVALVIAAGVATAIILDQKPESAIDLSGGTEAQSVTTALPGRTSAPFETDTSTPLSTPISTPISAPTSPLTADTPTTSAPVSRQDFKSCDFYPILKEIESAYELLYIEEYDIQKAYEEVEKEYNEGAFDGISGDDLTYAVGNEFIYFIGDKYGQYFTPKAFEEYLTDAEGDYVGIGVTIHYFADLPYNKVKGDNSQTVTGGLLVAHVEEGSLAKDMLKMGDFIIRIEGVSVSEIGYDEAINRVRGIEGTKAKFTVLRGVKFKLTELSESEEEDVQFTIEYDTSGAYEVDLEVERKAFEKQSVFYEIIDGGIGYIKITEFSNKTSEQTVDALVYMSENGIKKYIFDVRGNPGGSVDIVEKVLSAILDYDKASGKGAIFSVQDKNGTIDTSYEKSSELIMDYYDISSDDTLKNGFSYKNIAAEYKTLSDELFKEAEDLKGEAKAEKLALAEKYKKYSEFEYNIPKDAKVVVLTNSSTASAGELFTQIMRDYGISYTIGENTYGKGCMQTMYYLNASRMSDGIIKLTTHTYKSPYSDNYHGVGIAPDKKVELATNLSIISMYLVERKDDTQLDAAIEYLNK